jgi:catechol 2,3-dioxygenase-like lactoylglutathione lyase family enzyme
LPAVASLSGVLHHLTLWVPDIDRAAASWRWLLTELGYTLDTTSNESLLIFRDGDRCAVVLEQSPDMVPGMLHSRLRPGLNHVAFSLPSDQRLADIVGAAGEHGWSALAGDGHPISGGADVAYLEDRDGFEVELVAPAGTT